MAPQAHPVYRSYTLCSFPDPFVFMGTDETKSVLSTTLTSSLSEEQLDEISRSVHMPETQRYNLSAAHTFFASYCVLRLLSFGIPLEEIAPINGHEISLNRLRTVLFESFRVIAPQAALRDWNIRSRKHTEGQMFRGAQYRNKLATNKPTQIEAAEARPEQGPRKFPNRTARRSNKPDKVPIGAMLQMLSIIACYKGSTDFGLIVENCPYLPRWACCVVERHRDVFMERTGELIDSRVLKFCGQAEEVGILRSILQVLSPETTICIEPHTITWQVRRLGAKYRRGDQGRDAQVDGTDQSTAGPSSSSSDQVVEVNTSEIEIGWPATPRSCV